MNVIRDTSCISKMAMYSTSSSQARATHLLSCSPSELDYSPFDPYSTHNEAVPLDFRLERQGCQLATTVAFTPPPSRISAHRNSKKYWCHSCDTGFAEKQGFNRHNMDRHLQRNPCPSCRDFEWSPRRYYLFRTYLRTKHPGAAFPRTWS